MIKVNKEILKECANRLLFDLSDEQVDLLLNEFKVLEKEFDKISKIEGVDELEPMVAPFDFEITTLREDEVNNELTKDEILNNAPDHQGDKIKIKKVI